MALRTQTYEITALHSSLGLEHATVRGAREANAIVNSLAQRGFTHLWTIRTHLYRLGGFLQVRVRSDLGPLTER